MKKTLSVIALLMAAMMIVMCFAACGSSDKKDDSKEDSSSVNNTNGSDANLTGTYQMTGVEGEGEEYEETLQQFEALDSCTLVIDGSDGVLSMKINSITMSSDCSFNPDEMVATVYDDDGEGTDATYTFDGTILKVIPENNVTQVYEKVSDTPITEDHGTSEYDGTYKCIALSTAEDEYTAEQIESFGVDDITVEGDVLIWTGFEITVEDGQFIGMDGSVSTCEFSGDQLTLKTGEFTYVFEKQ